MSFNRMASIITTRACCCYRAPPVHENPCQQACSTDTILCAGCKTRFRRECQTLIVEGTRVLDDLCSGYCEDLYGDGFGCSKSLQVPYEYTSKSWYLLEQPCDCAVVSRKHPFGYCGCLYHISSWVFAIRQSSTG